MSTEKETPTPEECVKWAETGWIDEEDARIGQEIARLIREHVSDKPASTIDEESMTRKEFMANLIERRNAAMAESKSLSDTLEAMLRADIAALREGPKCSRCNDDGWVWNQELRGNAGEFGPAAYMVRERIVCPDCKGAKS